MIHGGSLSDHQPVGIHQPREDSSLAATHSRRPPWSWTITVSTRRRW